MMKNIVLIAAVALGAMTASAQAVEQPKFFDNWSGGIDAGVTTPMSHHPFFSSMRPLVGLHFTKQVTPTFGVGVEGQFGINTSSWKFYEHAETAFDNSYIGLYGTVDLFNLFCGYNCETRPFTIDAVVGAGWGHTYGHGHHNTLGRPYTHVSNSFVTKTGLNFKFNVSDNVTIGVSPYITWDMTTPAASESAVAYNINGAVFNLQASVTYHFGGHKFACVLPYNQAEVDALNGQINDLRAALDAATADAAAWQGKANGLANELAACNERPAQVVKEVKNSLNSVRYVFFKIGSSVITADQRPNVEMIADYLKNHKGSKVLIKGYASQDGNLDFNIKLAQRRAEAVKESLVKNYKIAADRITAEGEGIGHMFEEESWNRVSICTVEAAK